MTKRHIVIEDLEFDTDEDDHGFAVWYSNHRNLTKQTLMLGYHVIRYGIAECLNKEASTDTIKEIEALTKQHAQETEYEKQKHAKVLRETVNIYEDMLKQLRDTINVNEIRSVLEKEYDAKVSLATLRTVREVESRMSEEIEQMRSSMLKYKSLAEQELSSKTHIAVLQAEKEIEDKFYKEISSTKEDLSKYKALYDDIKSRYDNMLAGENTKKLETLSSTIQQYEKEISLLKKTNYAKGNKGEGMIIQYLKHQFPDYEYQDASKDKHSGDIHMVIPNNTGFIMIESKYKENITKQDVDKFLYDMEHLINVNKDVRCGIFVSILTRNIPHVGEIKIEFMSSSKRIPIIFVGFDNEAEFEGWFKNIVTLSIELGNKAVLLQDDREEVHKHEQLLAQLSPLVEQIKSVKTAIEKLRGTYMASVNVAISDLEISSRKLFENICSIVSASNLSCTSQEMFFCKECNAKFPSKRALGSHMRAHK